VIQRRRALIQVPLAPLRLARLLERRGVGQGALLVQLGLQLAAAGLGFLEAGLVTAG